MSTSSGFPLLKLPLLALETCVNLMSPDSVLGLSFHSKVFKSRLCIVKWKIESFEWVIHHSRIGFAINFNFGESFFEITTQAECDRLRREGVQIESINLNGTTVSLAKRDRGYLIPGMWKDSDNYTKFESPLATLETLTKFLMSFVKCSKFKLNYYLEENLLTEDFFVWQYVKGNLIDLIILGMNDFGLLRMTPDDFKFLLETLKLGYLSLNIRLSDTNFKYQGYLDAKELRSYGDSSWIELRNLNCQRVVLVTEFENSEQIEKILKNWIQGLSMEKLEYLELYNLTISNFNSDEILKDLKHENSRFSLEDIRKRIGQINSGFGLISDDYVFRDIQRKSDGRWGTLCIRSLWSFYFIVWTPEKLEKCCQETRIKLGLE